MMGNKSRVGMGRRGRGKKKRGRKEGRNKCPAEDFTQGPTTAKAQTPFVRFVVDFLYSKSATNPQVHEKPKKSTTRLQQIHNNSTCCGFVVDSNTNRKAHNESKSCSTNPHLSTSRTTCCTKNP
jgi:hypothetical protein